MMKKCGIRNERIGLPGGEKGFRKAGGRREKEDMNMNTVSRTRGIRKIIRVNVLGGSVQRHRVAGDRACRRMMREARARRAGRAANPGPSDSAILAWARFDLAREILGGFWDIQAA